MLDTAPSSSSAHPPDPASPDLPQAQAQAGADASADHPAALPDDGAALVLAVLSGRLAGAELDLVPGRAVTIGHAFDRDVVLRGAGTAGIAATLLPAKDGLDAAIRVDAGSVRLLGRTVTPGETLRLPLYLPLWLGDYAIAIGQPRDARWADAAQAVLRDGAARAILADGLSDDPAGGSPPGGAGGRLGALAGRWTGGAEAIAPRAARSIRRPGTMVAVGLGLLAVAAVPPALDAWRQWTAGPDAVAPALQAAGFGGLTVTEDPTTGAVIVAGLVADSAAEARLRALVAQRWDGARIDVQTPATLAGGVAAMLKARGMDADVAPAPGGVRVTSAWMPADAVAGLKGEIVREWPLARRITVRIDAARGAGPLAYFFPPARHGEAAYVDAAIPYIATGDGRHWYPGAVLPSGHVLTALGAGTATVRRGDHMERVTVGIAPVMPAVTGPDEDPSFQEPVPGDRAPAATPPEVTT